tara:strand:- start:5191 stop:5400 length:210 start_codon:yes stop_codon:yes gene_type:complete
VKKEEFKPHMMFDPKTGKGVKADTYEKHLALKQKGYVHSAPKKKAAKKKAAKRKSFTESVESRMKKSGY